MTKHEELARRWQEIEEKIQRLHAQGLQGSPEETLLLLEQDEIEFELGQSYFEEDRE